MFQMYCLGLSTGKTFYTAEIFCTDFQFLVHIVIQTDTSHQISHIVLSTGTPDTVDALNQTQTK